MATHEVELLKAARAVARLQTQIRKLRRQLKAATADLRLERKHLKALAAGVGRGPDVAPSRIFGDGVGLTVQKPMLRPGERMDVTPTDDQAARIFDDAWEITRQFRDRVAAINAEDAADEVKR